MAKVKRKLWIDRAFVDPTLCLSIGAYVILLRCDVMNLVDKLRSTIFVKNNVT
jgi:hypothetical protein